MPEAPDPRKEAIRRLQRAQEEILEARVCLNEAARAGTFTDGQTMDLDDFVSICLNSLGEASYRLRGADSLNANGRAIKWVENVGLTRGDKK